MKILTIISTGYVAGGAENAVVKITGNLVAKGHSVKTLASDLGADKEHYNDFVFKSINSANPLAPLLFLFNPSSFFATRKLLKEYRPDIVHLHTMHQITPSVPFLLKKYPTVMTLHGPETFISKLRFWCIRPIDLQYYYDHHRLNMMGKLSLLFDKIQSMIYRLSLKNVDVFIAPSRYMEKVAHKDVSPIMYLPNFIELGEEFHEIQQNHNLLFVGRLEKVKGVEFLIQAIPFITKIFPQTTLTIIGEGQNKENLLHLTKNLHLEKHVHFIGWVKHEDLDRYYQKASIVVIPSIWPENSSLVILEAMGAGRPVIGTNVGGISETIVDGVNGYLVEPQSPEQIAEKAIKLFSDKDLLKAFGKNSRTKAEEFTLEKYASNLVHIYEQIMSKYKSCNDRK